MNKKKQQIEMNLESWSSWVPTVSNKKDIYVIYFWPDTEALCIHPWNILQKTETEKVK